MTRRRAAPGKW